MNLGNQGAYSCTRVTGNSIYHAIMILWFWTAHEMDARRRMISKNFHHVMRMSERQALTGPPESMREHVVAASKAMKTGNWKECKNYIINEKMNAKVRFSLQMLHIVIVWMELNVLLFFIVYQNEVFLSVHFILCCTGVGTFLQEWDCAGDGDKQDPGREPPDLPVHLQQRLRLIEPRDTGWYVRDRSRHCSLHH